jgi:hypothetical protein
MRCVSLRWPGPDSSPATPGRPALDDHEQYAEDRGEQQRHAQRHVAMGPPVADLDLAAVSKMKIRSSRNATAKDARRLIQRPMRVHFATC